MSSEKLRRRVVTAAETALTRSKYVAPVEVLNALGWLPAPRVDEWRRGQLPHLEQATAVDAGKIVEALEYLSGWARERSLRPSETAYLASTRDRRNLRFTAAADERVELAFRTHWVSPELSDKRRAQLAARQSKAPDLVVVSPLNEWTCTGCRSAAEAGEFLFQEDGEPLCLSCADFDHLIFLPSGNAALSRRAKKESTLSAVVVRFNRRRKRYERQGILVEEAALERAEGQCLADADVRERRRERDAVRRAAQDVEFAADLAAAIVRQFPGCPADRARAIAEHAATRGSGRVGRSAAGRALDENAIRLAVIASVRHLDTNYDELLMSGVAREDARDRIRDDIDRVLESWRG
ncbi:DUF2293 domain-containing protein [Amycolatopsis anabasis]|uniref:DUF2293 domain-containing protein n=1 Tax=Amycolatopsis anabasis TaxID=1840409 RepID=UPI00131B520B|nr:DUF2293 domain-containing protein [Amycolatopsis anabasis]